MNDYIEAIRQNNDLIRVELNRMVINDITVQMAEMQENIRTGFANCEVPKPSSYVPRPYFCSCDIDDRKRDCYWYDVVQEMGVHISICGKKDSVECRNCKYYLSKRETNKIINKHFEEE